MHDAELVFRNHGISKAIDLLRLVEASGPPQRSDGLERLSQSLWKTVVIISIQGDAEAARCRDDWIAMVKAMLRAQVEEIKGTQKVE